MRTVQQRQFLSRKEKRLRDSPFVPTLKWGILNSALIEFVDADNYETVSLRLYQRIM